MLHLALLDSARQDIFAMAVQSMLTSGKPRLAHLPKLERYVSVQIESADTLVYLSSFAALRIIHSVHCVTCRVPVFSCRVSIYVFLGVPHGWNRCCRVNLFCGGLSSCFVLCLRGIDAVRGHPVPDGHLQRRVHARGLQTLYKRIFLPR